MRRHKEQEKEKMSAGIVLLLVFITLTGLVFLSWTELIASVVFGAIFSFTNERFQ